MNGKTFEQSNCQPDLTAAVVKRMLQIGALLLFQAAVLFISAGRLDWLAGWAYIGVYVGFIALNALLMLPHNAELAAERGQIQADTKRWDIAVLGLTAVFGLGMLIISGLDERLSWSPQFAFGVQLGALVLMALGYGLFSWAIASNRFFSSVVRIQKERGHTVVTRGPYRFVRHPGYSGVIVYTLATPLVLSSLWALIPAGLLIGAVIVRTALEDRMLQNELDGYREFSRRVRYRLLPGVW
jgi:protein-S-isoprenylcysteine O-methyltransferase Ste14